jgi:hypothetical protein
MAKNLAFNRGDTVLLDLALTVNGVAEDLTGAVLFFTAKDEFTDADTVAPIRKNSSGIGGITIVSATGGTAQVTISPGDTSGLSGTEVFLFYDVQLKRSNGQIYTVAEGTICVYPDVTISTT